MFLLRTLLTASLVFSSLSLCAAPAGAAFPSEQDRLIATARLWSAVNYFHPYVGQSRVDWDAALIRALPQIRSAATPDAYAAALRALLQPLRDPGCSILAPSSQPAPKRPAGPVLTWIHNGVQPGLLLLNEAPQPLTLQMGSGVTAVVNLSAPVNPAAGDSATSALQPHHDPAEPYPVLEARTLAAFKLWATVRNFFAYRDLMDGDWDDYFADFLPKFINAKDETEYNLAVAAALTHLDDTNAKIDSPALNRYFGPAAVGLRIRLVEKKPVVTAILDDAASKAGVKIGDVVTAVDGEDIVARIHREIDYIPASTNQSLAVEVCKRLLNGAENSTASLSMQSGDGNTYQVALHRTPEYATMPVQQRTGDATRFLSKAIGYVDLEKVTAADLDAMFEKFAKMSAIVFDLRGQVNVDPELIASRLSSKPDIAAAIVTGPITLRPDFATPHTLTDTASFFRIETFPPSTKALYPGKTIAVIDERTAGRAEHLGLLMEAANNTTFIGSLSAGVDGEVTEFSLPGGITYSFSTTDVRHGNSGKLQRIGLQPSQIVTPTLHSIRSGKDTTLEKAIESVAE